VKVQGNKPKSTRGAQSASQPGNNSGLGKQKGHPIVQFGPVLKEFLASKELVGKVIAIKYDQTKDQYDVDLTFKKVLDNGVSVSAPLTISVEDYLAQRTSLLKVKDESSKFVAFLEVLLDRLGLDLTAVKPSVSFKSVEAFILKHLSPVERAIVHLDDDEWNQLDTRKIPTILVPTIKLVESYYGSTQKRVEHLVKVINTEGPVVD